MPGTTVGRFLNLGFAGKVSRNALNLINAKFVKSILNSNSVETEPSIPFGSPVVSNTDNTVSLFGATGSGVSAATFANFVGIAVAEVKQTMTFQLGANAGAGTYLPTEPADVLEQGSCTVFIGDYTTNAPLANGAVYVVTTAGSVLPIGTLVANATPSDGSTTVQLTNCRWTTGKVDANGISELTILTRNNA